MNVLDLEFNAWAVGRLGQPHEQIDMFVAIEKEIVIATSLVTNVSDHVTGLLPFKFGLALGVRDKVEDVLHKSAEGRTDSS